LPLAPAPCCLQLKDQQAAQGLKVEQQVPAVLQLQKHENCPALLS
jgi:hypothetical protein